jgi:hypothetical protein
MYRDENTGLYLNDNGTTARVARPREAVLREEQITYTQTTTVIAYAAGDHASVELNP